MATWYVPSVILRPQLVMSSINPNETWRSLILVSAARELMQGENITRAFYMCSHSATNYGWGSCFHKELATVPCWDWQRRELVLQNGCSLASQCQHLRFLWLERQPSDPDRYASSLRNYKKSPLLLGPDSEPSGCIPPSVGSLASGPCSSKPPQFGIQRKGFSLFLSLLWEVGLVWCQKTSPILVLLCWFRHGMVHTSVPLWLKLSGWMGNMVTFKFYLISVYKTQMKLAMTFYLKWC